MSWCLKDSIKNNNMTTLKKGDKAPDFTVNDQDGNPLSLSDFKGKKVILFFYPKDDTPTCTEESCNLRDNYALLKKEGFVVLGISPDNEKKHRKFIEKFTLPYPLLADTEKTVNNLYGTWGEKMLYGRKYMGTLRTTFVIDEKGKILAVIDKVDAKDHAGQILETLKNS